jgi:hypothetical protein
MNEDLLDRLHVFTFWAPSDEARLVREAITEIERLQVELDRVKRTWIEPKPVTPQSKNQGSTQRWPFTVPHDHERQAVTGISIPETPA